FEDADDGRRPFAYAAQAYRFAYDGRIFAKRGCPETIREHGDAGGIGPVVLRPDETPKDRMKAHEVKAGAAGDDAFNGTGLTQADHRATHGGEVAERAQGLNAGLEILDFGHGERNVVVANAGSALPDIDQPGFVAVDQRLQQDAT